MEVKEGYKKTEVGVIPEDWEVKCIGDFCELTSSKRIFEHDYVSVGVPFYRGKEISMLLENKPITEPYYIAESKYESIRRRWGAPMKGEILITAVGTLCNVYLIPNDEKFYFKDGNLIWLRNISRVDFRFLVYQIDNFKKEIIDKAIGSSQKALTMVVLKKQLIPLPLTLSEQTAIATVLSDTDNLIQALEKKIAKKELIKKGAMQELLEPKEGWEVKALGEIILSNQLGGNYQNTEVVSKSPLIKMGNLGRGKINLSKLEYIPNNIIPNQNDILKYGDVILNTRNTLDLVGKVSIWRNELPVAYFNSNIMRLKFKEQFVSSNFYMNYAFNTKKIISQLRNIATGTTSVAAIYTRDLQNINFDIPPLEEQTHIAQILSDMDNEIELLQEKLSKYKQLKQGLMQELLTGRIRLV